MRILLIGEYSRLHNSLKEALLALGHEVTLVGNGDLFKKYPVDINIDSFYTKKYVPLLIRKLFFKLFRIQISDYETAHRFKRNLPHLKDYDIVQLINEDALNINPKLQIKLLARLISQNAKTFLLSCGEDHTYISYLLNHSDNYSIFTPYIKDKTREKEFHFSLKYTSKPYEELHNFISNNCAGIIATDLDYHVPNLGKEKYLGLIPYPINTDKIKYKTISVNQPIKIFHVINTRSSIKKGNAYFIKALEILSQKHGRKIEITTTNDLPYSTYIHYFNDCHIVLDQIYSHDQGYNALEAMAKGKVVFTGAEEVWLNHYNIVPDSVVINALPDVEYIVDKLEWLILNPEKINEISKNARAFIEKEHNYISIAEKYLKTWNKTQVS